MSSSALALCIDPIFFILFYFFKKLKLRNKQDKNLIFLIKKNSLREEMDLIQKSQGCDHYDVAEELPESNSTGTEY